MSEFLIPSIDGQKRRALKYKEIQYLIKRLTDAGNNATDEKKLREEIEKAKGMFTITSVMALVKGGIFEMGDKHGDLEVRSKPVHIVQLSYDYYIGKYEVTFNEHDAYCEATGKSKPDDDRFGREFKPVINVSWNEALKYCNWLSENEGLAKAYDCNGNLIDQNSRQTTDITKVEGYRLPTEAEWEYAARGGHKSTGDYKYAGSNSINNVAWYEDNSGRKTQQVGQKAPNELGLYDMSGNLWEWCQDWYNYNYYEKSPRENPVNLNPATERVMRGGYYNSQIECQIADRGDNRPGRGYPNLGLRIARTRK